MTTPEPPKLEACPFCGSEAKLLRAAGMHMNAESAYHVGCKSSRCLLHCGTGKTWNEETAIAVWNRRPAPTASPAPEGVAAYLEILRKGPRRTNLGAPDLIDWDEWAGRVYAAHDRLAAHVQSQSSTIEAQAAELAHKDLQHETFRKDIQKILDSHVAARESQSSTMAGLKAALEKIGGHKTLKELEEDRPLSTYQFDGVYEIMVHVARAAIKPVAPGKETV